MGKTLAERPPKARQPSRPPKRRPRKKLPSLTPAERAEAMERLRIFDEDGGWIEEHHQELLTHYPEEWVAVLNKRVIAHDPDFDSLLRKVPDPPHTNIWFITKEPVETVPGFGSPRKQPVREPEFTIHPQSKAMARRMAMFDEDAAWIEEYHDELVAQYPEQWIAVLNKRVIASDPDMNTLHAKVADQSFANVEFMTRDEVIVIL